MKNKLIYVIIFLFVILIGITIYKYKVYDKNEKKHYFIPMMPSNIRLPRVKVTSDVKEEEKDKILYKEYIITDDLKEIEYTYIVNNDESITGKIYIDDNKNLYITDIVNKKIYKPSNVKFKTMFKKDYPYNNIYIYLISEDNNLYKIKYAFVTFDNNTFSGSNTKLIITDNNDLIYEKDNAQVMGLFNKKVKDISFDEKVVGKAGKLIITFKDNYKIKLDAACNKYFCINEIEE